MSKRHIRRGALMWIPYEGQHVPWRFWSTFRFHHPRDITRFPMGDKTRRPTSRIGGRG